MPVPLRSAQPVAGSVAKGAPAPLGPHRRPPSGAGGRTNRPDWAARTAGRSRKSRDGAERERDSWVTGVTPRRDRALFLPEKSLGPLAAGGHPMPLGSHRQRVPAMFAVACIGMLCYAVAGASPGDGRELAPASCAPATASCSDASVQATDKGGSTPTTADKNGGNGSTPTTSGKGGCDPSTTTTGKDHGSTTTTTAKSGQGGGGSTSTTSGKGDSGSTTTTTAKGGQGGGGSSSTTTTTANGGSGGNGTAQAAAVPAANSQSAAVPVADKGGQ